MSERLLILGASTRAAAGSARRAGVVPSAIDLFCDDDLNQLADVVKHATHYPADLPALARVCPPGAWMYTGALENFPRIVDAISAERPLWGTSSDALRRIRDPWILSAQLRADALLVPEVVRADEDIPSGCRRRGRWIRKPLRSAGGGRVQLLPEGAETTNGLDSPMLASDELSQSYLQRYVAGESHSGVYVAARGAAALVGVTRQLVGAAWTGATDFRYCGSIGPVTPTATQRDQWRRIGDCLASRFDLQGLFGVDAIVNEHGVWTVEVNPRYTSSIEVLELGFHWSAIDDHRVACRDGRLPAGRAWRLANFHGKAVIYARHDLRIDDHFVSAARRANAGQPGPVIADIPVAGQTIDAGRPVVTLFAASERLADVEPRLQEVSRAWRTQWNL